MSTAPKPYVTPEEYLALERQAETKSEYFAGEIFAMAGASREHILIVAEVDTLLNPTLMIEVLSRTTEAYDRGKKFAQYRRLETLQEYLLVAQDQPWVERYLRQPDGQWLLSVTEGLTGVLPLPSIDGELRLTEVYRKIAFPNEGESAR